MLAEPVPVVPPVAPPDEEPPPGAVLEEAWAARDLKLARERVALAAVLENEGLAFRFIVICVRHRCKTHFSLITITIPDWQ